MYVMDESTETGRTPYAVPVTEEEGEPYTAGTGGQVYRINLDDNSCEEFARTEYRCLGSVVDTDGNLYLAYAGGETVLKVTPDGQISDYARGPGGRAFQCANYPAFDCSGNMYLSESGDWSGEVNGYLHKIKPGGGDAELWFPEPVDTPNAIALDAAEKLTESECVDPAVCEQPRGED